MLPINSIRYSCGHTLKNARNYAAAARECARGSGGSRTGTFTQHPTTMRMRRHTGGVSQDVLAEREWKASHALKHLIDNCRRSIRLSGQCRSSKNRTRCPAMSDLMYCFRPVFLGRADPLISFCPQSISQDSDGIPGRRKLVGFS
jgi:hypothetical protein